MKKKTTTGTLTVKEKLKPNTSVIDIRCKCGELQLKIYPWSSYYWQSGSIIIPCKRCKNKVHDSSLSSAVTQ